MALIASVGGSAEDGLWLGAAPSNVSFGTLEKAATDVPARNCSSLEDGLLFEATSANALLGVLEKVAAADGGSPMADGYHGPEVVVVKSSDASGRNAVTTAVGLLENGA